MDVSATVASIIMIQTVNIRLPVGCSIALERAKGIDEG